MELIDIVCKPFQCQTRRLNEIFNRYLTDNNAIRMNRPNMIEEYLEQQMDDTIVVIVTRGHDNLCQLTLYYTWIDPNVVDGEDVNGMNMMAWGNHSITIYMDIKTTIELFKMCGSVGKYNFQWKNNAATRSST